MIQKVRTGGEKVTRRSLLKTSGARLHVAFVLNAIGHSIVQMAMIVAIGARFYHEIQQTTSISNYLPSGQLWYMIVFGYIGPFIGVIMFLVTCHFWTQQFPIELCLDMLKLLQKPGFGAVILNKEQRKKVSGTVKKLNVYLDHEALDKAFQKIRNEKLERKLAYPFVSPFHVILCLVYCGCLLAFGLCAVIQGPTSTGWVGLYIAATLFAIFVNGYACAIAMVWLTIFIIVLLIIALILVVCFLACLGSSSDSSRRDYRR